MACLPLAWSRPQARKRALDILFEAEIRGTPVLELLAERITLGSPPVPAYAATWSAAWLCIPRGSTS